MSDWVTVNNGLHGTVFALAAHPTDPLTLFAGCYNSNPSYVGVYKTVDGGANWTPSDTGITGRDVDAIAIDPTNPLIMYAGEFDNGVYKSVDGGANWTISGSQVQQATCIAIDPVTPSNVYVGTWGYTISGSAAGGVYRSTNAGGAWTLQNSGATTPSARSLAIDPITPSIIYRGMFSDYPHKSTNNGTTWTPLHWAGDFYATHYAFVINPLATSTVFFGSDSNIYKSVTSGSSFAASGTGTVSTDYAYSMVIDPVNPSNLYANMQSGVYRSINGGASWSEMGSLVSSYYGLVLACDRSALYSSGGTLGVRKWTGLYTYKAVVQSGLALNVCNYYDA